MIEIYMSQISMTEEFTRRKDCARSFAASRFCSAIGSAIAFRHSGR
jgi:hypothetical protein